MEKIIIIGNSGAGKSTLAKTYADKYHMAHLDLDILAWENTSPPMRKDIAASKILMDRFRQDNTDWVIEGGYADLIQLIIDDAKKLIFLNPGVKRCMSNCRQRPWEPHKYDSFEKQNENLSMLLAWVGDYEKRQDAFSLIAHQTLYSKFDGDKVELIDNFQADNFQAGNF